MHELTDLLELYDSLYYLDIFLTDPAENGLFKKKFFW